MTIYDYVTSGGKNIIEEYINMLPLRERLQILDIRSEIERTGIDAFEKINTRQLRNKLWEIKISQSRIMYVIKDVDSVYFCNICKKQKNKAEHHEIDLALRRAKEAGII